MKIYIASAPQPSARAAVRSKLLVTLPPSSGARVRLPVEPQTVATTRLSGGFTLPEVMVSLVAGFLFLLAIMIVFLGTSQGFARMADYIDMDRASRNALDHMTRNVRQAKRLTSFTPSRLVFNFDTAGTTQLSYRYNPSAAMLIEEWTTGGATTSRTLLTGCSNLVFSLYDRSLAPTTDPSSGEGKVISVAWTSSRTTLRAQPSTENMQQAKIVIRNQP